MSKPGIALSCTSTAILLFASLWASDVQGQSLSITPVYVDATVKRGTTYEKTFTISNKSATRLHLRCSMGDFWYGDHNERIDGPPGTLPHSASNWVQFSPSEIDIEPDGSAAVRAVISVPGSAAGGYYTTPIFEAEPVLRESEKATVEGAAAASLMIRFKGLILLATNEATEYNAEVLDAQLIPPTQSSELSLKLRIGNRSTAHVNLHGELVILDAQGKPAGRGKIDQKRFLPGQMDLLETSWPGELTSGHYVAVVTLTYDRAGTSPATLVYELPFDVK